jgi:RNA polymerase sigma-70 factor (family 1)
MVSQSKNREWFVDVFKQYYDYIRNYLYYLSGDIEWSEDLVQDVFTQLWEKRFTVRDETIKPFLYVLARNYYLKDLRRRNYALKFISTQNQFTDHEAPDYKMEMDEFHQKLQKAISDLPEKCRSIYLMNRIDKLTYRQIAENLSVSEKAIEKQMSKALLILRSKLGMNI